MRRFALLAAIALALLAAMRVAAQDHGPAIVSEGLDTNGQHRSEVGRQRIIKLSRPCKRVSVARPDVIEIAMISPTQVMTTGQMPGSSDITIWDDNDQTHTFRAIVGGEGGAKEAADLFPPTGNAVEASQIPGFIVLNLSTGKVHLAIAHIVAIVIEPPSAKTDGAKQVGEQVRIVVSADAQEIHPEQGRSFIVPRERMGSMDVIGIVAGAKKEQ
jgi:pilus assembly protein CpaC